MNGLEVQNETDESFNVVLCKSEITGQLYLHLLGEQESIHGNEAVTVESEDYEIIAAQEADL